MTEDNKELILFRLREANEAFKKRQESDYLDFKEVQFDEAEQILTNAGSFLSLVINYFHDTYSLFFQK